MGCIFLGLIDPYVQMHMFSSGARQRRGEIGVSASESDVSLWGAHGREREFFHYVWGN